MKYIKRLNESLICSLDLKGGESILDLPIVNFDKLNLNIPKEYKKYIKIPTLTKYFNIYKGYEILVICQDKYYVFRKYNEKNVTEIFTEEEFEEENFDIDDFKEFADEITDKLILENIQQYFSSKIKAYVYQ